MQFDLRKTTLRASSALIAATALAPQAYAHTDSLGFIINQGATAGVFDVDIYYGSWHSPVPGAEGALDLSLSDGTLIGTQNFVLAPGFNGVSNGTMPAGLTPGVNYFFPDYMGALTGDPSGHSIYAFQYATFVGLAPGSYTFGNNAGSSFTQNWEPSDPMINAGAFAIDANGQLIVVGASSPTIDTSQTVFTSDGFTGGGDLTFDGGTLQIVGGAETVTNNFTVNLTGGTIDTNLMDSEFDGSFSGDGVVEVVGNGVVTVTGTNTHGGFLVNHAGIAAGDDAALGAPGAVLTLNHGSFPPTQTMSIDRDVVITSSHGGEFEVGGGITLTLNGEVSGSSCLYKRGLGALDLREDGSNAIGACVEEGQMAFNSTFTGNVWVDPGAFMTGSGNIVGDVEVSGTLSPGNSPGVMVVAGSVTQLPSSTLQVDIDGLTAGTGAGHYDTLVLTGGASVYTADGALAPLLRGISGSANNTFTPSVGDTFTIVSAEGGVTGTFDTLQQPGAGLAAGTRFDVIYTDDSIVLAVTADDYGLLTGGLRNGRVAGAALQSVRPAGGASAPAEVTAYFDGLAGLDQTKLAEVLQQTAGDIHANALQAAHRASRIGRDTVLERLNADVSRQVWGEAIGGYAEVDGDANAHGADYHTSGLIVGADAPVSETLMLGGAFAFVEADASADGRAQTQSYQVVAYGRWTHGPVFAHAAIAYSVDRYDIDRTVALSTGAEALASSPDGETFGADLEVGRSFEAWGATIDVLGGASWDEVSRDGVAESGADSVALSFGNEESDALRFRLGARYTRDMAIHGLTFQPYAQAFAVHFAEGADADVNPTLHGATFTAHSADEGETGLQTGLGFTTDVRSGVQIYLHYRGDFTESQAEHGVRLGARLGW